jgi:hypothetical protein
MDIILEFFSPPFFIFAWLWVCWVQTFQALKPDNPQPIIKSGIGYLILGFSVEKQKTTRFKLSAFG